jgi:hypothetical protein
MDGDADEAAFAAAEQQRVLWNAEDADVFRTIGVEVEDVELGAAAPPSAATRSAFPSRSTSAAWTIAGATPAGWTRWRPPDVATCTSLESRSATTRSPCRPRRDPPR